MQCMIMTFLYKLDVNRSWLRHLWLKIIPSRFLRHFRATTRVGNPYHHSCYARNVPFLYCKWKCIRGTSRRKIPDPMAILPPHKGGIYQFFVHFFIYKQMEPIFIFKKFSKDLNINRTFAVICYFWVNWLLNL